MTGDQIMTPVMANALHHGWWHRRLLPIWVIYNHPNDYPLSYVARPTLVGEITGVEGVEHLSAFVLLAATHEELIEMLPPHLTRLPRETEDQPHIMETWL